MAGWLLLQREISDHWIWKTKDPFDKRSAWIDLLMLANFRDFKTTCNGKVVHRKRGDVNTSIRHLADRWQWDKRKVSRFLVLLESDGMCTVNSTTDGTTITIENYDKYQLRGTTVGTAEATTDSTTDSTTVGTTTTPHENKDISKSKKKDKEIINKSPTLAKNFYSEQPEELKQALLDFEEMRKKIKKPLTDRARQLLLSKLTKLAGDDEQMKIAILEQSIMNSWQGVFPLKETKSNSGNPFWDMLQTGDY